MAKRVLVTRPRAQSQPLLNAISASGDTAIELPLLEIIPISKEDVRAGAIKALISRLDEFNHVIFISTNAAKLALGWIDQYWPQLPIEQRWYGIGAATAAELLQYKPEAITNSKAMNSEALLGLPSLQQVSGQKILIFRGVGGREFLRTELEKKGAKVSYCELYDRQAALVAEGELERIYNEGLDFLTASSGETIQKLLEQAIISKIENQIRKIPIVVPGDRVSALAKQSGFERVIKADNAAVDSMLRAMKKE